MDTILSQAERLRKYYFVSGMSTRPTKVRKAEAMETATSEPLAFPETKIRRVDGAPSIESAAGYTNVAAAIPRPSNWATFTPSQKSMWRRRNKSVVVWGEVASAGSALTI